MSSTTNRCAAAGASGRDDAAVGLPAVGLPAMGFPAMDFPSCTLDFVRPAVFDDVSHLPMIMISTVATVILFLLWQQQQYVVHARKSWGSCTHFSHMHELENVNLNLYHKHSKSALLGGQKEEEKKTWTIPKDMMSL
jgi:hypothetical protein